MVFSLSDLKRVLWTFVQAFLSALVLQATNVLNSERPFSKELWLAALVAAVAAALSAIKNGVLADDAVLK
jgi:hypothetical protein